MPNPENIEKHKFTSENQPPAAKKSRKGIPNRATVFKKLLKLKLNSSDLSGLEIKQFILDLISSGKVTLHEAMALGQIQAAILGNTKAFQEIQDSVYGKIKDESDVNVTGSLDVGLAAAIKEIYGENKDNDGAE